MRSAHRLPSRLPLVLASVVALTACVRQGDPGGVAGKHPDVDGEAVLATVAELASPAYAGRAAGSEGGAAAREWLSGRLALAGLDVRQMPFPERVARNVAEARLELDGLPGGTRVFAWREDYREVVRGGFDGGEARGTLVAWEDLAGAAPPAGCVLLLPGTAYRPDGMGAYADAGVAGVLVELPAGTVEVRPLWPGHPGGTLVEVRRDLVVLALSSPAYAELLGLARAGGGTAPIVDMASPVRFQDVSCVNLIAEWNGDGGDFEPRFAFMAHYDHVGTDQDGNFFPGALDNASGAALVLELARAFAADGRKADVAFILTDGEEVGLSGAAHIALAPPFPLYDLTVVNLDMIGSSGGTPVSVYSNGDRPGLALADELVAVLEAAGLEAVSEYPVPNVDHAPLVGRGAIAATICEYDTAAYHTKRDAPSGLSAAELDAVGDALYAFALGKLAGGG